MTISVRYAVIRVVPDPVRDEPVNVGVILQNPENGEIRVRVIGDVEKLRRYTGEAVDTSVIEFALEAIEEVAKTPHAGPDFLSSFTSQYTQQIQFSGPAGSLAEDLPSVLNQLYDRFVSLDQRGIHRRYSMTRRSLISRVREAFEQRAVEVKYRRRLDGVLGSYVFDFLVEQDRYRSLQCVSLGRGEDDTTQVAKALAYSVRDIRKRGEIRSERPLAGLTLTSLVIPPPTENPATESIRAILADVGEVRDADREFDSTIASFG